MELFILLILFAAWLQSMFKLILLPRPVRWMLLAASVLPVFLFKERLAACNLQMIGKFLSDGSNLRDFCALIVIQELLSFTAGLSLLKEHELGEKIHAWKYAALIPSLLLPVGAMYAEAAAFNMILNRSFTEIMWGTGIVLFLLSALSCELFSWLRGTLSGRISAAMTASWILLLLAIFMPAAVEGKISSAAELDPTDWTRSLVILAVLAGIVIFTGILFHLYRTYKERKQKCVM